MKKGRPAHTLYVLAAPRRGRSAAARPHAHEHARASAETPVTRSVLDRSGRRSPLPGGDVRIKVGLATGRIVHATPEFEDAAALARAARRPGRGRCSTGRRPPRWRPGSSRRGVAQGSGHQGAAI